MAYTDRDVRWPSGAGAGLEVEVSGSLRRPRTKPNADFDWPAYLRRRGIALELKVDSLRLTGRRRGGPAGAIDAARRRAERGLAAGLSPPHVALARGMVLGQDERVAEPDKEDFRRSGLAHILAVSGQNIMLLCALAVPFLMALGACQRTREPSGPVRTLRGMAIGHARTGEETQQLQMVSLDDLVPADDRYRRIEPLVGWQAVRASAAPFYGDRGRPSVDPVVLVKLFLVASVEGIASMRETLRMASDSLAIRRFLGYGLTERLPSHATLSYAQCVRFAGSSVFEQLFTQVLARCHEQGLLEGSRLVLDATHVEASAALKSLRAELTVIDGDGEAAPEPQPQRPALALAEPRSGPTPRRKASNQTAHSLTDPDAKLRHKPGQRPHLVHRAQVATDPKARCIVTVAASRRPATKARRSARSSSACAGQATGLQRSAPTRAMPRRPPTAPWPTSRSRPSSHRRRTCATPPTAKRRWHAARAHRASVPRSIA
jgi:transposase